MIRRDDGNASTYQTLQYREDICNVLQYTIKMSKLFMKLYCRRPSGSVRNAVRSRPVGRDFGLRPTDLNRERFIVLLKMQILRMFQGEKLQFSTITSVLIFGVKSAQLIPVKSL